MRRGCGEDAGERRGGRGDCVRGRVAVITVNGSVARPAPSRPYHASVGSAFQAVSVCPLSAQPPLALLTRVRCQILAELKSRLDSVEARSLAQKRERRAKLKRSPHLEGFD